MSTLLTLSLGAPLAASGAPTCYAIPSSLSNFPLLSSTLSESAHGLCLPASNPPVADTLTVTTWSEAVPKSVVPPPNSTTKSAPFRFASSLAPIPAKLVQQIQALEFVEMRELLPDNVALAEHLAALQPSLGTPKQPEQREVDSLMTWVSSFSTYVAIIAQAHPHRVLDMLAYMRLIIREATKYGGNGWLTYDSVFRRNQEGQSQPWNSIDPSLHIAYISG